MSQRWVFQAGEGEYLPRSLHPSLTHTHAHTLIHTLKCTHSHTQAILAQDKEPAQRCKGPRHPSVWEQEPLALFFSPSRLGFSPCPGAEAVTNIVSWPK